MDAVFWGTAPIFSKKSFNTEGNPAIASVIYTTIGSVCLLATSFVIYGYSDVINSLSVQYLIPFVCSGIIGTGIGRILNYNGIRKLGASINSGLISFNPVFASVIALLLLDETYSHFQILAVVTSSIGLLLIAYSGGGDKQGWRKVWILLPLCGAFAYGFGAVLRRYGLQMDVIDPILATGINELSALFVVSMYVSLKSNENFFEVFDMKYTYLIIGAILNTCGILSLFVSLNQGPVVIGTTLSSLSAVVSLIITSIYMRDIEEVNKRQIAGTLITVISVVIVVTL